MIMCMNDKFSLTSFSLTSFLGQVFTVASNTMTQRTRIKTATRRQFRFFIMAHAYLTREKRVLACGLGCASLVQYEHSKRHMNQTWWVRPFIVETQMNISSEDKGANVSLAVKSMLKGNILL